MSGSGPLDPDGDPFAEMAQVFARFVSSFGSGAQLNFDQAKQMAGAIANDGETEFNVDPLERIQLEQLSRVAELHITEITGLSLDLRTATIEPTTRAQWTSNTLDAYRPLFERLTDSLGSIMRDQLDQVSPDDLEEMSESLGPLGADPGAFLAGLSQLLGPMMLSMMAGSTVGHLGRRAFGSFDLPIPRRDGGVMVVAHNVDTFANDWSLPPEDLRLWICLSELTHRAVLDVPHVRDRLTELLSSHASAFASDSSVLEDRLGDVDLTDPEGMDQLQRLLSDPDIVLGAIRSDEQRRLLPEIDALVVVVEGYVDWMLDTVSSRLLSSSSMVSEAMRRRRVETDQASRFIERLFGLELTQDKLDRGNAFVQGVVERAGGDALRRLWSDPAALPTVSEVDAPGLWLARLGIDADQPLPELDDVPDIPDFPDLGG
ncbi:MAG TPA: zinc-dependent metalloprotease [Microthrixaceae bacterium]|nr:zinc-dependent metalloprotease [Microthrixaceae bacterium]